MIIVYLLLFIMSGCQEIQIGPIPPNATSVNQSIELVTDYLGSCSSSVSSRDVRALVVWEVSTMSSSGQLIVFSASDTNGTGDDMIFNDDSRDSNSRMLTIQAPSQGDWFLRLEVQLECDACCGDQFIPSLGRMGCPNFDQRFGESVYMAAGAMMSQVISPSPIVLAIENISCFSCRSTC